MIRNIFLLNLFSINAHSIFRCKQQKNKILSVVFRKYLFILVSPKSHRRVPILLGTFEP
jgi:hypothetical protein